MDPAGERKFQAPILPTPGKNPASAHGCTAYRMNRRQTAINGQWDGLSEQSAGDERSKHVIVNVCNADPHLGDQPVRVPVTDVIATSENWSRGLRCWNVPRVMWRLRLWWWWWRRVDENRQRLQHQASVLYIIVIIIIIIIMFICSMIITI